MRNAICNTIISMSVLVVLMIATPAQAVVELPRKDGATAGVIEASDPICTVFTCVQIRRGLRWAEVAESHGLAVSQLVYFKVPKMEGVPSELVGTYPNLAAGYTIVGEFPNWRHFENAYLGIDSPERVDEYAKTGKNLQHGLRSNLPGSAVVVVPKEPDPCLNDFLVCRGAYQALKTKIEGVDSCQDGLWDSMHDVCVSAAELASYFERSTKGSPTGQQAGSAASGHQKDTIVAAALIQECNNKSKPHRVEVRDGTPMCVPVAGTVKAEMPAWARNILGALVLALGIMIWSYARIRAKFRRAARTVTALFHRLNLPSLETIVDDAGKLYSELQALRRQAGHAVSAASADRQISSLSDAVDSNLRELSISVQDGDGESPGEKLAGRMAALTRKVVAVCEERTAQAQRIAELGIELEVSRNALHEAGSQISQLEQQLQAKEKDKETADAATEARIYRLEQRDLLLTELHTALTRDLDPIGQALGKSRGTTSVFVSARAAYQRLRSRADELMPVEAHN